MVFQKGHKFSHPTPRGNSYAVKHSLHRYRRMLAGGKLDARSSLYKVLHEKERELVAALGGDPSPQERIIIADAVKSMLYVGTLDEYLLKRDGSIVKKTRVIPVVDTRTKLASHLRDNLRALGLHRRVKQQSLGEILSQHDD